MPIHICKSYPHLSLDYDIHIIMYVIPNMEYFVFNTKTV